MKLAFISGPYRAPTIYGTLENIRKAEKVALKYWQLGYAVICPHKNTALYDGTMPDDTWLWGHIEILKRCDVIVMMQGWEQSDGAVKELRCAEKEYIEIIFDGESDATYSCD